MSLHKFAEQVAANGRGEDSLLVHMTPDEVGRLQKFAEANGTSLTINPTTGLPEAGMLSDLFKAVAPIALGAFLGPAGMGISFGGLSSALSAGIATGGITALATGSLSRGLMAGLGAYGGAGLGANLMGAGTASIGSAAEGIQGPIGSSESGFSASQAISAAPKADVLSAGFKAAAADPMAFAKTNLGNLAYAAAPLMAMQPTTKMPETKSTGNIRQFDYNINPETGKPDPLYGMRAMTPVKASEFGDKTFQGQRELFRQQNPNPYELGVGSLNQPPQQPPRMNTGGIVALAGGGDAALEAYQAGNYGEASRLLAEAGMSAQDVVSKYGLSQADAATVAKNLGYAGDMSGIQYAAAPAPVVQAATTTAPVVQAAAAAPAYTQYTNEQIGSYLADPLNKDINIQDAIKATNADPTAVNAYIASLTSPFVGSTLDTRGSGTLGIYNNMVAQNVDPDEYYKSALANDPKYAGWSLADIKRGYKLDEGAYALSKKLSGNVSDKDWVKFMDEGGYSVNDMAQAFGLSTREVQARYDAAKSKTKTTTTLNCGPGYRPNAAGTACEPIPIIDKFPDPFTSVVPGGTQLPGATTYDNGAFGNYGSGNKTGVDYLGRTVSIATPGDIITNPDDSRTVVPNIPGRPYGGFTGIDAIKSAYTAGGGSLGYTAKAPKTKAEFDALYNKQTGDSLAAYDYLMGKGAGKYPVKSGVPNIAMPYGEAVLGKKPTTPKTTTTTIKGVPGQPQTYFDEKAYLAANPDVAAEMKAGKSNFTSAYEHWLMYGQKEGRPFTGDYTGYTTAAALANAARESGGDGPSGPSGGNNANSISGFNPAPPDNSIPDSTISPDSVNGVDAVGGYYSRGKLNYGSKNMSMGGATGYAIGGGLGSLGSYSDGGRLLKGPGDGVSDSIPATIGAKNQPARLADGEFVIPARIVSELGNGSTDAGAKKLYAMMDRVQRARGKTTGKNKVAANSRSDKYLPA